METRSRAGARVGKGRARGGQGSRLEGGKDLFHGVPFHLNFHPFRLQFRLIRREERETFFRFRGSMTKQTI